MCYKWQLLDLDNRVTVTMGNLSEIGGETFRFCTTLRMYDRSIHLRCLTYDRPPKHKKSVSNYNSWTVQWHTVVVTLARGAHGSKPKHTQCEKYFKGWASRSGLCPNRGGIFRPSAAKLIFAGSSRGEPATWHLLAGETDLALGRDFTEGCLRPDPFPFYHEGVIR